LPDYGIDDLILMPYWTISTDSCTSAQAAILQRARHAGVRAGGGDASRVDAGGKEGRRTSGKQDARSFMAGRKSLQ